MYLRDPSFVRMTISYCCEKKFELCHAERNKVKGSIFIFAKRSFFRQDDKLKYCNKIERRFEFSIIINSCRQNQQSAPRPEWSSFLLVANPLEVVEPVETKPAIKKAGILRLAQDKFGRIKAPK